MIEESSEDKSLKKKRSLLRNDKCNGDKILGYQTENNGKSPELKSGLREFGSGDIVWVYWGNIWYAAMICNLEDVPSISKEELVKIYKDAPPSNYAIVRFYVDGT